MLQNDVGDPVLYLTPCFVWMASVRALQSGSAVTWASRIYSDAGFIIMLRTWWTMAQYTTLLARDDDLDTSNTSKSTVVPSSVIIIKPCIFFVMAYTVSSFDIAASEWRRGPGTIPDPLFFVNDRCTSEVQLCALQFTNTGSRFLGRGGCTRGWWRCTEVGTW